MSRRTVAAPVVAALVLACCSLGTAEAQTTQDELWPELDLYWTDRSGHYRLFALASVSQTADIQKRTGTLGLHADYVSESGFFLWPSGFYARIGYNRVESMPAGTYHEQRGLAEITSGTRIFFVRLVNRTRVELRWIGGRPSQRYRDRIRVDHAFVLHQPWVVTPFAAFEPYYDTQYHALSRTGYRFGGELARGGPLRVDLSYVRQDNRFGDLRHVNALAFVVSLRFGGKKE